MSVCHIAVIDVGKTNVKLVLVNADDLQEITHLSCANRVVQSSPYPHFDVDTIWQFLLHGLQQLNRRYGVDALTITTHGASAALLDAQGTLAAPVMDYEFTGIEARADAYQRLRPTFSETGSPLLPGGLNLGAQLHWQLAEDTALSDRLHTLVTYPQYWAHRLCGVLACDETSLGCHTDLWKPYKRGWSDLPRQLGIADKMATVRPCSDVLGTVLPSVVSATGLSPHTPVYCGIHDSNASLLPYVLQQSTPFSVVSTGTWVVVMGMGGQAVDLDPARDTLVNVNALGEPVPSARFMGGREFDLLTGAQISTIDPHVMDQVAQAGPWLLPSVVNDCGPFQGMQYAWHGSEPEKGSAERVVTVSFYLAMMTAYCLSLTGHQGELFVEGPFVNNEAFLRLLSVAAQSAVSTSEGTSGTSEGAALLAVSGHSKKQKNSVYQCDFDTHAYRAYAKRWKELVAARSPAPC